MEENTGESTATAVTATDSQGWNTIRAQGGEVRHIQLSQREQQSCFLSVLTFLCERGTHSAQVKPPTVSSTVVMC